MKVTITNTPATPVVGYTWHQTAVYADRVVADRVQQGLLARLALASRALAVSGAERVAVFVIQTAAAAPQITAGDLARLSHNPVLQLRAQHAPLLKNMPFMVIVAAAAPPTDRTRRIVAEALSGALPGPHPLPRVLLDYLAAHPAPTLSKKGQATVADLTQQHVGQPPIERFYAQEMERYRQERVLSDLYHTPFSQAVPVPMLLRDLFQSVKYRFTLSAEIMFLHLYDTPSLKPQLPRDLANTWIEFGSGWLSDEEGADAEDKLPLFLYAATVPPYEEACAIKTLAPEHRGFARYFGGMTVINFIAAQARFAISALYRQDKDGGITLMLPPWHICAYNACEFITSADAPTVVLPCEGCRLLMGTCYRTLAIALAMAAGDFAEHPDAELPTIIETSHPAPPAQAGKGRGAKPAPQPARTYTYKVVTFDASVRPRAPRRDAADGEREERGSWLEVDPQSIIYVGRHIAQRPRTLDPARNARWAKKGYRVVDVREHDKKIPMRVGTMRRITASNEEEATQEIGEPTP